MSNSVWKPGVPPQDWDAHQSALGAHFLQGRAWALFQQALGKQLFYASGANWSWVAMLESNRLGSRLYAPNGPTAKSPESLRRALEALEVCAQEQHVDYIRIDPHAPNAKKTLKQLRAYKAHRDIQPRHNFIKDLDRPEDELFGEMMSTNRRLYRRAAESGFTFRASQDPADIKLFLDMIHQVAARTGIQPHSDEYFTAMAQALLPSGAAIFHVAEHNGSPVATALTFESATTRYYAHAATAESARKLQPSVYLVGHLIFDAKRQGKKFFDYNGVAPPHAPKTHKWAGFSQFKRSFGGRDVEYAGTWEIPIKKARYQAYRLLHVVRQVRGKVRPKIKRKK